MLTEMRHTTDQLRNIFWEQEKKIEYLKRDLSQIEEVQRGKAKEQAELTAMLTELERALKIKKTELSIEKDNESSILTH
jgi:DNA topoisomerase VI subunit A